MADGEAESFLGNAPSFAVDQKRRQGSRGSLLSVTLRVLPLLLGSMLEWYEWAAYSNVEPNLARVLFRGNEVIGWAMFTVGFMVRPMGGLFFGVCADRWGQRHTLVFTIVGMVVITALQGTLPTYCTDEITVYCGDAAGLFGVVALGLLRLSSGLLIGGELATLLSFLLETSAPERFGWISALLSMMCDLGFMLSGFVTKLLSSRLTPAQMDQFGWRIPFLLVLPVGLGMMPLVVHSAVRTEEFAAKSAGRENAGGRLQYADKDGKFGQLVGLRDYLPSVALVAFVVSSGSGSGYLLQGGFVASLLENTYGWDAGDALGLTTYASIAALVVGPFIGLLADRIGLGKMMILGCLCCVGAGIVAVAVEPVRESYTTSLVAYAAIAVLLEASSSSSFLWTANFFPQHIRVRAVGVAYNLSPILLGGVGMVACQRLVDLGYSNAHGVTCTVTASLAAVLLCVVRWSGRIQMEHRRAPHY